jgi:hypothetical protein
MGFKLEYLDDGTAKGILDLKEEFPEASRPELKNTTGNSALEEQRN